LKTIWKYESRLPKVGGKHRVQLGEGDTPLVKSRSIGKMLGIPDLYFKLENLNPTGSYKDRFAAVLVSEMVAQGKKICIATSSGNTGAALSAYCAASGIRCVLVVVDGAPLPKVRQMQLYGADIYMVKGFGKNPQVTADVFDQLEKLCGQQRIPLPISAYRYCASAMQGVQTIVYEILEELENPGHIFVPAGGGGLTLAICRGAEIAGAHIKINCVQPEGNDTIATALREHRKEANAVNASTTKVSGLQVASVIDGDHVIEGCRKSGGNGYTVRDGDIFKWQKTLAQTEGIFCEPAGAAALAGLENALTRKEIDPRESVVCLVTGSGFKDMGSVDTSFNLPEVGSAGHQNIIQTIQTFF
jgi:threonine synthase